MATVDQKYQLGRSMKKLGVVVLSLIWKDVLAKTIRGNVPWAVD